MQRTPHRRKSKDDDSDDAIDAKTFGDLVTADHIVLGSESDYSRHGDTAALVIQDFGTKWLGAYPAPAKSAAESKTALQHFVGKAKVKLLYSDGSGELDAASRTMEIPHDVSTPQRPQNNGVAERAVRRVIEGTRCCLLQSGLTHQWWREAMRAYCYNRNASDVVEGGKTPYEHRFGQPFGGLLLPFGCSVEYKPESERETKKLQKFGSKLRPGIFMGHHAHNGGAWSGDYYIVDAEAFAGSPDTQRAYVHRVKEILHDGKMVFPRQGRFASTS